MPSLRNIATGVLLLAAPCLALGQTTVALPAAADVTLYENRVEPAANGSGAHLFTGMTLRGAGLRRAILRFDLSSIPSDAVISDVQLTMFVTRVGSGPTTMSLHRVLSSWGEGTSNAGEPGGQGAFPALGDATWEHRFWPTTLWNAPGGDFVSASSASLVHEFEDAIFWSGSGMVADVQSWLSNPTQNFGWLIQSINEEPSSARRLASSESLDTSLVPQLEVTFQLPCDICPGDFNCDGGVDGDDVIAFLTLWDNGEAAADFNRDDSTDGDDVIAFFTRWDAGC